MNTCILLFLFIMQTLEFFTLFIFHYFLFIYMFPFCLHTTSVLYKPAAIFFCIIKRFWTFHISLKFLYVLDKNKVKFYCNILLFNCKKTLIATSVAMWFIRLGIVRRIFSGIFEGDSITSQIEGYLSVLLFSILLCHIGL